MILRRIALAVLALMLAACATSVPGTRVQVTDLKTLAGSYSGTMNEASELNRSVNLVLTPDGTFQMDVGDPKGFRTAGKMTLQPDGTLAYEYNEMKGQGLVATGTAVVSEGDGRRGIVLTQKDGQITTSVSRSLP